MKKFLILLLFITSMNAFAQTLSKYDLMCDECEGKGYTACGVCKGRGYTSGSRQGMVKKCFYCDGTKVVNGFTIGDGRVKCDNCKGSGKKTAYDLYRKGRYFFDGNDYESAIPWYKLASDQGDAFSSKDLSIIYRDGKNGIPANYDLALKYALRAWDQGNMIGDKVGAYGVGKVYETKGDYTNAINWYIKAGDKYGGYYYVSAGICYKLKLKDVDNALKWYLKGGENGESDGYWLAGDIERKDKNNIENAIKYYKIGSEQGNVDCSRSLAKVYDNTADIDNTLLYYKKAYDQAEDKDKAQYSEKINYLNDINNAKVEAEQGNAEAQQKLGDFYCQHNMYDEALNWELKAAEQGYAEAQQKLGDYYYQHKMYDEALNWDVKAALQCNEKACAQLNNLCYVFANGNDKVEKSKEKALEAIDAAIKGSTNSIDYMDSKGEILYIFGDTKEAKKVWEEMKKRDPGYYDQRDTPFKKYMTEEK